MARAGSPPFQKTPTFDEEFPSLSAAIQKPKKEKFVGPSRQVNGREEPQEPIRDTRSPDLEPATHRPFDNGGFNDRNRSNGNPRDRRPTRDQDRYRQPANNAPKETGVVLTIREHFGFIRCANRQVDSLFFHFSELDHNSDIRPGDGVSFIVCLDNNGRDKAGKVSVIPKESINWTRPDGDREKKETREVGTVTELRDFNGFLITPDGIEASFLKKELPAGVSLREGDLVEFRLMKDRDRFLASRLSLFSEAETKRGVVEDVMEDNPSRRKGQYKGVIACEDGAPLKFKSCHVFSPGRRLTRLAKGDEVVVLYVSSPEGEPKICSVTLDSSSQDGVEQGVVSTIKESYCFLRCVDRAEQLFLHFSEVADDVALKPGLELQFHVAQDGDRLCAFRASPLPEGTVKFTDVLPEVLQGTVTRDLSAPKQDRKKDARSDKREALGELTMAGGETLVFRESDIFNLREELMVGDVVSFQISIYRPTKTRSATDIKLLSVAPPDLGVVLSLAPPAFSGQGAHSSGPASEHRRGLLHSLQRPGTYLTFLTEELDRTPEIGEVLQFNVRKHQATRVRFPPEDHTQEPIETAAGPAQRLKARVINTPKPADGHLTGYLTLLGTPSEDVNFVLEDVHPMPSNYECFLRPGDIVECSLVTHVRDASIHRAVNVQFAPRRASVALMKRLENGGGDSGEGVCCLLDTEQEKRDRDRNERREELPFSVKDVVVAGGASSGSKPSFRRGDQILVVEVAVDGYPRRRVTKFQRVAESEGGGGAGVGAGPVVTPAGANRFAKGPDGTKGFAPRKPPK